MSVLFGVSLIGGCAAPAQGVTERGNTAYFQSSDATGATAGPFVWARVDPRFHISVDELTVEVDGWSRAGKNAGEAAPVLAQLADALDAIPRVGGDRAGEVADSIRAIGDSLKHERLDTTAQRRALREALVITAWQLTSDARGTYAADPDVERAVAGLRVAAAAISETGADGGVEDGLVAARNAVHAFEIAVARGRVALSSD